MRPFSISTPSRLEPETLDVADDADGRDHPLGRDGLALAAGELDRRGHAVGALLDPGHFGARQDADAGLLKGLARERRDLGVLGGQDLGQDFDDGYLGAERAIERGELDADGARAGDEQRLWQGRRQHGLEVGPDQLAVGLYARKHARARSGREDDVARGIASRPAGIFGRGLIARIWLALRGCNVDRARSFELRLAPDDIDAVLLEQEADAGGELAGDRARALDDGRQLDARRAIDGNAEASRRLDLVQDLGRPQQRLGWNAAPVEADAAEECSLDDGRAQAELRGADRGDVAAGPGADDDHIIRARRLGTHIGGHGRRCPLPMERPRPSEAEAQMIRPIQSQDRYAGQPAGGSRANQTWQRAPRYSFSSLL